MRTPRADKPDAPSDPRRVEVAGLLVMASVLYALAGSLYLGTAALPEGRPASPASPTTIFIRVHGEVQEPGLYRVPAGARVGEAIALAGGPTREADLTRLNLAAGLLDDSLLRVPSIQYGFQPVVFINRCSASELVSLSGIGPELARRIVHDRDRNGPFRRPQDLLRVRGIGSKKLATILKQGLVRGWGP